MSHSPPWWKQRRLGETPRAYNVNRKLSFASLPGGYLNRRPLMGMISGAASLSTARLP